MVYIEGNVPDIDKFISTHRLDSFSRGVLGQMYEGRERFEYGSPEQLLFELKLRKNIVEAARKLGGSRFSFRVFRKSKCNEEYWIRTPNGGFQLRRGVSPYKAIRDIYLNGHLYGTECATAMVIVYYIALTDSMPEDVFNRMYPDIYLMDWQQIAPVLRLRDYEGDLVYLPGDARYFRNPDVNPLTPEWQGENVIYLGNGLYWGHGIGTGDAEKFIKALNRNRRPGSDTSAYLMSFARRPDFIYIYRHVQKYSSD